MKFWLKYEKTHFSTSLVVPPANAGDKGSIPGLGTFHMLQSI